jgi:predicted nucleic acid-binding protein
VKLLLAEEGSGEAAELWDGAAAVRMASVGYAEVRAALAAARCSRRLSPGGLAAARAKLELRWSEIDVQDLDELLVRTAGNVAETFALRALDAVHLAAALSLEDEELVLSTWDDRLRTAAQAAGLAVAP